MTDLASSPDRIPGAVWKNMGQLRTYLKRQGATLITDADTILDIIGKQRGKRVNAAFRENVNGMFIAVREGATTCEVIHEMGHMIARKRIGATYWDLADNVREHIAASFVRGRSDLWRKLTPEEQIAELNRINPSLLTDELRQKLKGLNLWIE